MTRRPDDRPPVPTITREDYDRSRRHGYAGPLTELSADTAARWAARGATHWQLQNGEGAGTVLAAVRVGAHPDGAAVMPVRVLDDTAPGWCCVDCTMLLVNGETPPEMGEDDTAAWLAGIDRRTAGYLVTLGRMLGHDGCECPTWDCDDHRDGCERVNFSWSSCDVCGSGLGGERHAVTFHPEREQ